MALDFLKLQPHKVSRDLSGYITYIYGPAKAGKTTLGSQMPKPILLAFERGYNALPGVYAQDILNWGEMRQALRELRKPAVKEMFSTVVIDTVDIAAALCDKYVCAQHNVDTISQIPYGQGWNLLKKEFEEVFRSITQMGYAVFFISHAKERPFKRPDGTEYTLIGPSVGNTYNSIIENMADIYGYMHPVVVDGRAEIVITLRSTDGTISAGGRFKYIEPEIPSNYESLVKALNAAIDKEAALTNNRFVTDEKNVVAMDAEIDFDGLMKRFNEILTSLLEKPDFEQFWSPRIVQITDKYLGRGRKVSNCNRNQGEQLQLIVYELEEMIKN